MFKMGDVIIPKNDDSLARDSIFLVMFAYCNMAWVMWYVEQSQAMILRPNKNFVKIGEL